jgi:hypothetical protein
LVKFRPKKGLYVKRPTLLALGGAWLILYVVGTSVSFLLWWGLASYLITFIVADSVYDPLMEKFNQNTRAGIFATYLPVVVLASFVADAATFYAGRGTAFYYSIFPSLPQSVHQMIATGVVSVAVVLLGWGRAGMLLASRKR